MMRAVKITQVRSLIKRSKRQKNTIKALGLGRMHSAVVLEGTPQVLGMIGKVAHLVRVETYT